MSLCKRYSHYCWIRSSLNGARRDGRSRFRFHHSVKTQEDPLSRARTENKDEQESPRVKAAGVKCVSLNRATFVRFAEIIASSTPMELQLILFVHILGICLGLKETRIQIPTAVKKGDSVIFRCWYDTEGDTLYAVKWYKGGREFYRYTPNDTPAIKTFPIGTLNINKEESNATQVAVTGLELDAGGRYSCEVSVDAPSFHTAIVDAEMNVVELPVHRPAIHGMKRKYRIGDILRGNCTSDGSNPAANLTWYINDRQPLNSHIRHYNPQDSNNAEQMNSVIGLQFLVTPDHFTGGKLKVRCSASIYDVYWQSTEVSAEEDRPKGSNLEPGATIVGINYLQPPPNFQTGQRKPDGQADVKDIGSSAERRRVPSMMIVFPLSILLQLILIR